MNQRPDADDLPHREWRCEKCKAVNSMWDGDCQFCDDEEATLADGGPENGGTVAQKPDLVFADHGSIWLMTFQTPAGQAWISEHIPEDAQTFGNAIAIEFRYVADIIMGAQEDGLTVSN